LTLNLSDLYPSCTRSDSFIGTCKIKYRQLTLKT
jgi:hypothetical protein